MFVQGKENGNGSTNSVEPSEDSWVWKVPAFDYEIENRRLDSVFINSESPLLCSETVHNSVDAGVMQKATVSAFAGFWAFFVLYLIEARFEVMVFAYGVTCVSVFFLQWFGRRWRNIIEKITPTD